VIKKGFGRSFRQEERVIQAFVFFIKRRVVGDAFFSEVSSEVGGVPSKDFREYLRLGIRPERFYNGYSVS
jgi:hypothetical protein